jgi:hypothetical protein
MGSASPLSLEMKLSPSAQCLPRNLLTGSWNCERNIQTVTQYGTAVSLRTALKMKATATLSRLATVA